MNGQALSFTFYRQPLTYSQVGFLHGQKLAVVRHRALQFPAKILQLGVGLRELQVQAVLPQRGAAKVSLETLQLLLASLEALLEPQNLLVTAGAGRDQTISLCLDPAELLSQVTYLGERKEQAKKTGSEIVRTTENGGRYYPVVCSDRKSVV